ncbi:hypothetical protein QQ045_031605 [Rhodiola kirilowii]
MGLTSLQVCMDMDSASDQHHRWALQATMHEDALMDSSASPSEGDMLGPSQILMSERRLRPPQDQALKCPRCDSTHTKFCYYNNYSLSQPRYFCKTCRRYWTKGGTLRNIPVGGGFRKNRKSSSSSSSSSSKKLHSTEQQQQPLSMNSAQLINHQNPNPLMMMMSLPNPVDLQLSFQTDKYNNGYPFSLPSSNMIITSGSGNGNNSGGDGYSESMHYNHNNIASLESSPSGFIRPIDFCLDHKQVEALVMNNTSKSNNNHDGYSFNSQFVAGGGSYASNNNHLAGSSIYSNVQNLGYAHDIGLSYIDGNISASHQSLEYSGLHEHHDIPMDREVKPNTKMLALEWQQEGFSDARSSKDTFECLGSWSGMSSAGNYHHHHHQQQQQQLLLQSATTNSSVL